MLIDGEMISEMESPLVNGIPDLVSWRLGKANLESGDGFASSTGVISDSEVKQPVKLLLALGSSIYFLTGDLPTDGGAAPPLAVNGVTRESPCFLHCALPLSRLAAFGFAFGS